MRVKAQRNDFGQDGLTNKAGQPTRGSDQEIKENQVTMKEKKKEEEREDLNMNRVGRNQYFRRRPKLIPRLVKMSARRVWELAHASILSK